MESYMSLQPQIFLQRQSLRFLSGVRVCINLGNCTRWCSWPLNVSKLFFKFSGRYYFSKRAGQVPGFSSQTYVSHLRSLMIYYGTLL